MWGIIAVLIALYLALVVSAARISVRPIRISPFNSIGLLGAPYREATFVTADGLSIRGTWTERPGATCAVVLCHGFQMNRSEVVPVAYALYQMGCSCLSFDFRAHGQSEGRKTGFGYLEKEDVRAAVHHARQLAPEAKIVLYGSSMGGAACAFACAEHRGLADALLMDSVYSRFSDAIAGWWRLLGGRPLQLLLWPVPALSRALVGFWPSEVDVTRPLAALSGLPMLFLHGTFDDIARPEAAERNLSYAGPEAKVVWFEGCGHSEGRVVRPELFNESIAAFLKDRNLLI